MSPVRSRLWRIAALTGVVIAALSAAVALATTTYTYCNGCTINAGDQRTSAATRFAVLSYEHRLSGPGSSQIKVQALANSGGVPGSVVCSISSLTTEAACDPGGAEVFGRAWNLGAGNYGFNAHLTY